MKMSRQNPGGQIETRPTMKGCEFGIGKGSGMSGMGKGAHFVTHKSPTTALRGAFVTAKGQGLK